MKKQADDGGVCPICLDPVVPVSVCHYKHSIHTVCAQQMQRVMGRDTCPLCNTQIELPALPMPPLWCILEHSVHVVIACSWLLICCFDRFSLDDGWRRVERVRNAIRSRQSTLSSTDLAMIRIWSVQTVCIWMTIYLALTSGLHSMLVSETLPRFMAFMIWVRDWHIDFYKNTVQSIMDMQFTTSGPCPCDPKMVCLHVLSGAQAWAQIQARVAAALPSLF